MDGGQKVLLSRQTHARRGPLDLGIIYSVSSNSTTCIYERCIKIVNVYLRVCVHDTFQKLQHNSRGETSV